MVHRYRWVAKGWRWFAPIIRKSAKVFDKPPKAWRLGIGFNPGMYQPDVVTGETIFSHKPAQPAQRVVLVGQADDAECRIEMHREQDCWLARVKLKARLFVYRFEVDGRARWDREAGKVKFPDGKAWSLAVIAGLPFRRGAINSCDV